MVKASIAGFLCLFMFAADALCADTDIRLNTIGFLPDKEKRASVAAPCSKFSLVRSSDSVSVFSGTASGPKRNMDTQEDIYIADFSTFTDEGNYYLKVDDVGRSAVFSIKQDVYNDVFRHCVRAMYLWRCGCPVSGAFDGHVYSHAACHTSDAYMDHIDGSHTLKPSLKGWHDAGDFNKYTVNAGITVGMMLNAWEQFGRSIQTVSLDLPEAGAALPEFLAEIKWELDWLLTMQMADGSVSHKVSTLSFCGFIMPEAEKTDRFFVPWGSAATADFTAMTAMAGRIYKAYDSLFADSCCEAAKKSWDFLSKNTANHNADQTGFSTGAYTTTDKDDRLWAAAEMWETFGDAKYLSDFESRAVGASKKISRDWDWGSVGNLGLFTYVLSKREGKRASLADSIKTDLTLTADTMVTLRGNHGYGRPLDSVYYWGCNGTVARQTMVLQIADIVSPKKEYGDAALDAIGHLFGRNWFCRSFVTGLGRNPPLHPHDRRSIADTIEAPWPGYLVGGGWPGAKGWIDADTNYQTNEIAINWQGALIYALAGFIKPPPSATLRPARTIRDCGNFATKAFVGFSPIKIPRGRVCFYDCTGRLVGTLVSEKTQFVAPKKCGLGGGLFFMHPDKE